MKNLLGATATAVGMMLSLSTQSANATPPGPSPEQRAARRAEIARIIAAHEADAAQQPDAGLTARVSADGTANLEWRYTAAASGYEWEIWGDAKFRGRRIARGEERGSQPFTSFKLPSDQPDYYWRMHSVSATNDAATTGWKTGPALTLSCVPLTTPTQTNVSGSSCASPITAPATPALNWSNIANESGYAWEIYPGVSCTGASSNNGATAANVTTASPASPLATGTYHWRVKGIGDGVNYCDSGWQCGCAFTVGTPSCTGTAINNGTISANTTWSLAGSPYLVSNTLTINSGVTLSVDPGVIIKMGANANIQVFGALTLNGNSGNYVSVSSLNDSSACGPSPGGSGSPAAGNWNNIYFHSGSSGTINRTVIRYATEAIRAESTGAVNIFDSIIENSTFGAVVAGSGSPNFINDNFFKSAIKIQGNSIPLFFNGVWDGGGTLLSAGAVNYDSNTPDPTFSGITLQNYVSFAGGGGRTALDISVASSINGATHWNGVPFYIANRIMIAGVGQVDAANTTLLFSPFSGGIDVNGGTLNLGTAGQAVTLKSNDPGASPGSWQSINYMPSGKGAITNATFRNGNGGGPSLGVLTISATAPVAVSGTLITDCGGMVGIGVSGLTAPTFTNVNLTKCTLQISGNSKPVFSSGAWDGGGTLLSAGAVNYDSNTPDPTFSGITLQNYVSFAGGGGRTALDISVASSINGATHWNGVPFYIANRIMIAGVGQVDAANTTLLFSPFSGGIDVNGGTLNLGTAGQAVTLKSNDPGASPGSWQSINYMPSGKGAITNATFRNGNGGGPSLGVLTISATAPVAVSGTLITDCGGMVGIGVSGLTAPTFTNVNLTKCTLQISGNSKPVFSSGAWDGGGTLLSAGAVNYDSNTPDPTFSGITLQNYVSFAGGGGRTALDISVASSINGATHWNGVPFYIANRIMIAGVGQVDAANTTLLFSPFSGGIDVNGGTLNLGTAGQAVTLKSNDPGASPGSWQSINYMPSGKGAITNATFRNGNGGGPSLGVLTISATAPVAVSGTLITDCGGMVGIGVSGLTAPTFTNVNLTKCTLQISGNSKPVFSSGTWDGGGTLLSAGAVNYDSNTPDPTFSGITLQNYVSFAGGGGRTALDISVASSINGATHWNGVPFYIANRIMIAGVGQVDAANTTLLFSPFSGGIDVNGGTLNLGTAGQAVTLKSNDPGASPGSWQSINYMPSGKGAITNATFRNGNGGGPSLGVLTISATAPVAVSGTLITDCGGMVGIGVSGLTAPTFTNVNLTKCTLQISGNSKPVFSSGAWDGGGTLLSAGAVNYDSNTPDPTFSGITLQNYVSFAGGGGRTALDISVASSINGATHWNGVPFYIANRIMIAGVGQVDAANTTLLFSPFSGGIDVNGGTLNLGTAGQAVTLKSNDPGASPAQWGSVAYLTSGSGTVTNTTIQNAQTGLDCESSAGVNVSDTIFSNNQVGMVAGGGCLGKVERTVFTSNPTAVRILSNGSPNLDLGGGTQNSAGYNTLIGGTYSVDDQNGVSVSAKNNWWGCPSTAEMDTGQPNITLIDDYWDNFSYGFVDFSNWVGTRYRSIRSGKDTTGGLKDVVLSWPQEPSGTLRVRKGFSPQSLSQVGTTSGANYRDVGELNSLSSAYYGVDGPCP